MSLSKINPTMTPAWKMLLKKSEELVDTKIIDLFANSNNRIEEFSIDFENMFLDFSKNIIDKKNILLFLGSNFHHVIYPVSSSEDLNLIAIMKYKLSADEQKNYSLFDDKSFIQKILNNIPLENKEFFSNLKELKIFPVFVSDNFFEVKNKNIFFIGDAFFAFPPSFAQGASQSIEGAYELFVCIENNSNTNFFKNRVNKTKMVNNRSKLNQLAFHLSNPLTVYLRNIFLKKLVKNKSFLESYLGKIYR